MPFRRFFMEDHRYFQGLQSLTNIMDTVCTRAEWEYLDTHIHAIGDYRNILYVYGDVKKIRPKLWHWMWDIWIETCIPYEGPNDYAMILEYAHFLRMPDDAIPYPFGTYTDQHHYIELISLKK